MFISLYRTFFRKNVIARPQTHELVHQAVKDFGAFVTIARNIDGLCHRSEYSSSIPSRGDSVYVKIMKIEYDSGKIAMYDSLSLKVNSRSPNPNNIIFKYRSMSCVNQETGQEEKENRFYKIDLGSRTKWVSKRTYFSIHIHTHISSIKATFILHICISIVSIYM